MHEIWCEKVSVVPLPITTGPRFMGCMTGVDPGGCFPTLIGTLCSGNFVLVSVKATTVT